MKSSFLFVIASKPALGHTQPPIQWVPGDNSPGLKREGCEATTHFSAEVKNEWSYTFTYPYIFMACCLIKKGKRLHDMDNFTFSG
jgi:hypothetical protein